MLKLKCYIPYVHHAGAGSSLCGILTVHYLGWCIGEVSSMAWSIGGAVHGFPAVLVKVIGSCQLMLQSGQLVRFEGFPWVRQALQRSQSGDTCRRCIGILVLSNKLHDQFDFPCGVSIVFWLIAARFAFSVGTYSTEVSDIIVESVVL